MFTSISVVIPCYNSASTIERALKSVLDQTHPVLEVIIVDDGSTDNTRNIISKYSSIANIVYQTNGGPSKARNTGIRHAKGNFIAFLDSDDYWYPDKLKTQVAILKNNPNVYWSYTGYEIKINNLTKIKSYQYVGIYDDALDLISDGFTPNSSTVIVKSEIFNNSNFLFNEKLKRSEDREVWLKIACLYPKVAVAGKSFAIYDKGLNNGLTSTAFQNEDFSFLTMKERLYNISSQLIDERKKKLDSYLESFNKKAIIQIWANSGLKIYPYTSFENQINNKLNFYLKKTYGFPILIKKSIGLFLNYFYQ